MRGDSKGILVALVLGAFATAMLSSGQTYTNRPSAAYYRNVVSNLNWITEGLAERMVKAERTPPATNCDFLAVLDSALFDVISNYLKQSEMSGGTFNDYLVAHPLATTFPVWTPVPLFTNIHVGYMFNGAARWTNHPSDGTLPWRIDPQALIERKRVLTNLSYLAYAGGLRFRTDSPSNYFNSTALGGPNIDFYILLPPPGAITDLAGAQTNTLTYSAWPNTNRPYGATGQDYSSIG